MSTTVHADSPAEPSAFPDLPGWPAFVWDFWMRPVSLYHALIQCGITKSHTTIPQLESTAGPVAGNHRLYVIRLLVMMSGGSPLVVYSMSGVAVFLGATLDWNALAFGVVAGIALGVVWGCVSHVAMGVIGGIWISLFLGLGRSTGFSLLFAALLGLVSGVMLPIGPSLLAGRIVGILPASWRVAPMMAWSIALSAVIGQSLGWQGWGAKLAVWNTCVCIMTFRLPLWPVEWLMTIAARACQRWLGCRSLRWTPVLFHELSFLPLPGLQSHILATADEAPDLVARVLAACERCPGQEKVGRAARELLQTQELLHLLMDKRFMEIVDLQGQWLPGVIGASQPLLAVREVTRSIAAASMAPFAFRELVHLRMAKNVLDASLRTLHFEDPLTRQNFRRLFDALARQIDKMQSSAEKRSEHEVPNPFLAGQYLTPESGGDMFRGRDEIVQTLRSHLGDSSFGHSLVLIGPKRMGKTSLLKMLPRLLPERLSVYFDVQNHPVSSAERFVASLVQCVVEQAALDRRLAIPPLPVGPWMEAFREWFRQIEVVTAGSPLLVCIDEFDELTQSFQGSSADLRQILGTFRAVIQHQQNIQILISGSTPPDEADALWTEFFINMREIWIDHLDRNNSIRLLSEPTPAFPSNAIPVIVAERIFERTNGQPFLLQLYGSLLVQLLNEQGRRESELGDVERIEPSVMQAATIVFRDSLRTMPDESRTFLLSVTNGDDVDHDTRAALWLQRHCVLSEGGGVRIPVYRRWIVECWEE